MYTDKWFSFPVRIYDMEHIMEIQRLREEAIAEGKEPPKMEPDWIAGMQECDPEDISGVGDSVTEDETNFAKLTKEGFMCSTVSIKGLGEYLCTWNREKFKNKLNEFMQKREKDKPPYANTVS